MFTIFLVKRFESFSVHYENFESAQVLFPGLRSTAPRYQFLLCARPAMTARGTDCGNAIHYYLALQVTINMMHHSRLPGADFTITLLRFVPC
jgi:hypothetical protein